MLDSVWRESCVCVIFVFGKQLMIVTEGSRKNIPCLPSTLRLEPWVKEAAATGPRGMDSRSVCFWALPGKCSTESKKLSGSHSRQDTGRFYRSSQEVQGNVAGKHQWEYSPSHQLLHHSLTLT